MCTLPLLAGENVSDRFVVPAVASAVDLVVHLGVDVDGRRRVREILGVPGRVEEGIVETSELFVRSGDRLVRADGYPPAADRCARAGIHLGAMLRHGPPDEPGTLPDVAWSGVR